MSVIERSPRIETRRLALRAPVLGDAGRIADLANDLDVFSLDGLLVASRVSHCCAGQKGAGEQAAMRNRASKFHWAD